MTAENGPAAEDTLTALLRIHREVLEKEAVTPTDNFYDLGGNSLLGMRMIKRIAEVLGVRTPAKAVFTADCVQDLAAQVDAARERAASAAAPADAGSGSGHRGRASMAQEWAVLASLDDPDAPALQFHVVYRLRGPLDSDVLRGALQALIDHHPTLRTGFRVQDGTVLQDVVAGAAADLVLEDVSRLPEDERTDQALQILEKEVRRTFDRTTPPLVRAVLVRSAPEDHHLALVFDHIAADGWSLDIITEDLGAAYRALATGERPQLPPAGAYPDWAARQWEGYGNGRADEVADYWKSQLGPDPATFALRLPGYRTNTGLSEPDALSVDVPAETGTALHGLCRELRTTPYVVALAALKALIARQTGLARVTVLTSCANRLDPEFQGTVGWFANGVFPTTDIGTAQSFRDAVEAVRETTLAATAHGDLPAWYVRRRMWPEIPSGFRKDPGVYFMFNELWGRSLRLGDAAVEPVFLDETADSPGLHMWLLQDGAVLRLQALFHRSEYPADYVRGFAGEFLAAIAALAGRPDEPLRDVLPHGAS
ncbi:condensation domain-containing protein [Streptomyces sp. NPDC002055]|uniref:condensation domain-containing protein n=1 Tax=Streptomyces sp. NPDC002055 TaxID=3154534 RepID=UPI00332D2260